MKLPEEEADNELGKRLREKFEGFNAPVKDQVRINVFAALGKSSRVLYWISRLGALLLVAALFIGYLLYDRKSYDKAPVSALKETRQGNRKTMQPEPASESEKSPSDDADRAYSPAASVPVSTPDKSNKQPAIQSGSARKLNMQKEETNRSMSSTKRRSHSNRNVVFGKTIRNVSMKESEESNPETDHSPAFPVAEQTADLALLSSIDSINMRTSLNKPTIPHFFTTTIDETVRKPRTAVGIKGIFSAAALQTFQIVNLSQSATDRIQNFQFAPLLSSKSLSYKLTAGIERKHTQLLLSYTYLRNWNEYEIGTNQVSVTRTAAHQYSMLRIGEKHVEDNRSHLIGIGLRQSFQVPQNILKNYTVDLGLEYTRVLPDGQDLVWGNLGFYKQVYQTGKTRLQIGPYLQYSFIERSLKGQSWKSRPYQVGISFGVKMK